jgi:hypothetical protein
MASAFGGNCDALAVFFRRKPAFKKPGSPHNHQPVSFPGGFPMNKNLFAKATWIVGGALLAGCMNMSDPSEAGSDSGEEYTLSDVAVAEKGEFIATKCDLCDLFLHIARPSPYELGARCTREADRGRHIANLLRARATPKP